MRNERVDTASRVEYYQKRRSLSGTIANHSNHLHQMSKQTVHPRHPPFSSLPLDPNGPNSNAWGMFGLTDELGMLNLLTPAVVASAATEIVSGIRISLDWPLDKPTHPLYKRKPFEQQFLNRGGGRVVNDDILCFNTQGSSQWDGFRHYGRCA